MIANAQGYLGCSEAVHQPQEACGKRGLAVPHPIQVQCILGAGSPRLRPAHFQAPVGRSRIRATSLSVAEILEGVDGRDGVVVDPLWHAGGPGRVVEARQLLAEAVQWEAHHIEEVAVDVLHQHPTQRLDPVAAGLVPAWREGPQRGRKEGGKRRTR